MQYICRMGLRYGNDRILKDVLFWNMTSCGSSKSRRLGGIYCPYLQRDKILSLTSSKFEVPHDGREREDDLESCHPEDGGDMSSVTSILTRATLHHILEDSILPFYMTQYCSPD